MMHIILTLGKCQSITDNINTELNKYLVQAEKHKSEDNYFKGCDKATNTLPKVQKVFHHQDTDDIPLNENTSAKIPESLDEDTGFIPENDNAQQDDCLSKISEESHVEEDPADQDKLIFDKEIDQSVNEHLIQQ